MCRSHDEVLIKVIIEDKPKVTSENHEEEIKDCFTKALVNVDTEGGV